MKHKNLFEQLGSRTEKGFHEGLSGNLVNFLLCQNENLEETLNLNTAAKKFANAQMFKQLIANGYYGEVSRNITPDKFWVLDAVDNQPFKPQLITLGEETCTKEANEAVGAAKGTTAQFLRYLINNPKIGLDFPVVHLNSTCKSTYACYPPDLTGPWGGPKSQFECCLLVFNNNSKRQLDLAYLGLPFIDHCWKKEFRFFSATIEA